jgi:hypothetical protein
VVKPNPGWYVHIMRFDPQDETMTWNSVREIEWDLSPITSDIFTEEERSLEAERPGVRHRVYLIHLPEDGPSPGNPGGMMVPIAELTGPHPIISIYTLDGTDRMTVSQWIDPDTQRLYRDT